MDLTEPCLKDLTAQCAAAISSDRLAATLGELIRLPSVNPFGAAPGADMGEKRVADYLGERLASLGWTHEITEFAPGRHNVLARLAGAAPEPGRKLMFAGHTDTVETTGYPAALADDIRDGRVYGRGACDMKAALACYLEVAEILAAQEITLAGELLIAGVGDEEYRQEGAKAFGATGERVGGVVIGEPTELTLCLATKGLAAYELVVIGSATHGSVPQHGDNAILSAAELLRALGHYEQSLARRAHPLLGHPTINVGVIDGGTKPNIVPSSCRIGFSRRLLPGETPEAVRTDVVELLERFVDNRQWELNDAWWTVEPYELPDAHPLGEMMRAAAAESGADATPLGFAASSDAAYFGSPVVLFGPGSLAQAHSLDEWVAVADMVTATEVYLRVAMKALGVHNGQ
jgi:acetylornithine deacetylase